MAPWDLIERWSADRVAAAVVAPDGDVHTFGDPDEVFDLASVTKLLTAMAVLVAHEEGTAPLESATAPGATVADLLAHSGGIGPDEPTGIAAPRTRRIYSTSAYDLLAEFVAGRAGIDFPTYLHEAVVTPLDMTATVLVGSAGSGAISTVSDLVSLTAAWRSPLLIDRTTLDRATTPHLPSLDGVLPGFGRQAPNPWGLGPEIRGDKDPHWTGGANSPQTYGHFGRSGTMLWIDPVAAMTAIVLTDRQFGPWAATAWPEFNDAVLSTWAE